MITNMAASSGNKSSSKPYAVCNAPKAEAAGALPSYAEEMIREHFELVRMDDIVTNPDLGSKIEVVFLCPWISFNAIKDNIEKFPNLKCLANHGVGVDHIDVKFWNSKGVKVGNTPDVLSDGVADLAMMLMLAPARNMRAGMAAAMGPAEPKSFNDIDLGVDVCFSTLGIVGMGSIGAKIAERAKGYNMNILYYNRTRRSTDVESATGAKYVSSLHELLPQCDFVAIACPCTQETTGLIGEKEFKLMKKTATIVNVARGKIINTSALVQALSSGTIRGAGLDVTDPEPLPRDHLLLKLPNVVITAHQGSATIQTRKKMVQRMIDNALAAIQGKPLPSEVTA